MSQSPIKILICGVLPPPIFGHSMMYHVLMKSPFATYFDITFINMNFWSYKTNQKVTLIKLVKLIGYLIQYIYYLIIKRPQYVLFNMSFYRMPFLKNLVFCALGHWLGSKIVLHDHGYYVKELYDASGPRMKTWIKWLLKISEASIVLEGYVREYYEGLMDQNKLYVGRGSVEDSANLHVDVQQKEGINILYFANMSKDKGIWTAFDVAIQLLERSDITLTFAGPIESDDIQDKMDELIRKYPNRIEYLGYIADDHARAKLFREADIYMFTTLREAFGLVLIHALAEGVPVVASHEGAIPKIIEHGINGFLAPKGDAQGFVEHIFYLADHPELRAKMAQINRQKYESTYSVEKYGQSMIDIFELIHSKKTCV